MSAYDITTSCELFHPERLFAVVGELNSSRSGARPIGIELYPTRHSPLRPLTARRVRKWQSAYNAQAVRVHLEFLHDRAEVQHVIRSADRHGNIQRRVFLRALYWMLGNATSGLGIQLARGLGVGINIHSNVVESLARQGLLPEFRQGLPFAWAENNIAANYLYTSGKILYDPRTIIECQVQRYALDGFLLGLDHLIDHYAVQRIAPKDVLADPLVRQFTRAIHLAAPGHAVMRVDDPEYDDLLGQIASTPFQHQVRVVLDYSALALLRYSFREEVELFRDTLAWLERRLGTPG